MDLKKINQAIELLKECQQEINVRDLDNTEAFVTALKGLDAIATGIRELEMAKSYFCTAEAIEKDEL